MRPGLVDDVDLDLHAHALWFSQPSLCAIDLSFSRSLGNFMASLRLVDFFGRAEINLGASCARESGLVPNISSSTSPR